MLSYVIPFRKKDFCINQIISPCLFLCSCVCSISSSCKFASLGEMGPGRLAVSLAVYVAIGSLLLSGI